MGDHQWDVHSGPEPPEGWCGALGFVPVVQNDGQVVLHVGHVAHDWQSAGADGHFVVCRRCRQRERIAIEEAG